MDKKYDEIISGKIGGTKIKFSDRVICSIYTKVKDEEKEIPLCYDFLESNLKDVKKVIDKMVTVPANEFIPDLEYENFKKKQEEREQKWWYKLKESIEDIGVHFTPFDWSLGIFFVTRPVPTNTKNKSKPPVYKLCGGFYFGPFTITWKK